MDEDIMEIKMRTAKRKKERKKERRLDSASQM